MNVEFVEYIEEENGARMRIVTQQGREILFEEREVSQYGALKTVYLDVQTKMKAMSPYERMLMEELI